MPHPKHLLTCLVFALLLLGTAAPAAVAQSGSAPQKTDGVVDKPDAVMHVTGLSCSMCARSVTNALKKLGGVDDVQVLLEDDQRILLTFKKGVRVDEEALRGAVERAGFSTRKVVFKSVQGASS